MYDSLLHHLPKVVKEKVLDRLNLKPDGCAVLTTHRPENVDNLKRLKNHRSHDTNKTISNSFPSPPTNKKRLKKANLQKHIDKIGNVRVIKPIEYHEMINLIKKAKMVFTDSGGLQKEAFLLHTLCITIRERTEWVETIKLGANMLVGNDKERLFEK